MFKRICTNCKEKEISIIKFFFIIHGIVDNQCICLNCKEKKKIAQKSLKKYKYSILFLAIIYLLIFVFLPLLVIELIGLKIGGSLGVILVLLVIFYIEFYICKKITLVPFD